MTVWFTSDTHFGHANVIKYCDRPFADASEMDEMMIVNWNAVVRPGDHVYHLGDFSFHRDGTSTKIVRRLMGNIHLIRGNHDSDAFIKECGSRFVSIKDLDEVKVDGTRIVMCHFPMLTWNKSHHGSWHLHGHCHGKLAD